MIGESFDVLPNVLHYHIDQPLTSPMWIYIYLFRFSVTNKNLVDQAFSGRLMG